MMSPKNISVIFLIWTLKFVVTVQAKRCDTLFMCPTFCMKMQDGCYVCNCGTFLGYMKNSANEINRVSNAQSPQTGSQLSSFVSGYGGKVENPTQTGTGTGFIDYRGMLQKEMSSNIDPSSNTKPFAAQQLQRYLYQSGGIIGPDFTGFGQSSQSMPGMSCKPVSTFCPATCWSTDVYTGCIHCKCGLYRTDKWTTETSTASTSKPTHPTTQETKTTTTQVRDPSPNTEITNNQKEHQQLQSGSTVLFKIPTPRPISIEQKIPTPRPQLSLGQNDGQGQGYSSTKDIKVPTLPPVARTQRITVNNATNKWNDIHRTPPTTKSSLSHISSADGSQGQNFDVYGSHHEHQDVPINRTGSDVLAIDETPIPAYSKDFHMNFDDLMLTNSSTQQRMDTVPGSLQSVQTATYNGYQAIQNTGTNEVTTEETLFEFPHIPSQQIGFQSNNVLGGYLTNDIDRTEYDINGETDSFPESVGGFFGNVMDETASLQDMLNNGGDVTDSNSRSFGFFQKQRQMKMAKRTHA